MHVDVCAKHADSLFSLENMCTTFSQSHRRDSHSSQQSSKRWGIKIIDGWILLMNG